MEGKKKSGSGGIGRIFSLSLNEALSDKRSFTRNAERGSRTSTVSSPESDKSSVVKPGQSADRNSGTDAQDKGKGHSSPGFQTQSDDAFYSQSNSEELEKRPCRDIFQQIEIGAPRSCGFGNRKSPKSLKKPCGHVSKDNLDNEMHLGTSPSLPSSQRVTVSPTAITGSHARLKSKITSERQRHKPKHVKNGIINENHTNSRFCRNSKDDQRQAASGKTCSSFERLCFETKTTKRLDSCTESRGTASAEYQLENSSGKRNNKFKRAIYKHAQIGIHAVSDTAVSSNDRSKETTCSTKQKQPYLLTASVRRISVGKGKEHQKDCVQRSGAVGGTVKLSPDVSIVKETSKKPRNDQGEVRDGGSARLNSAFSEKEGGNTNIGSSTTCRQAFLRRGRYTGNRMPTKLGGSLTQLNTSHMNLSAFASSPLLLTNKQDSQTDLSFIGPGTDLKDQEDMVTTQEKISVVSQMKSKENPLHTEWCVKRLNMNDNAEVFSNSDRSEVEVWFDVKDNMNKQDCGSDMKQQMDSSVNKVLKEEIQDISKDEVENQSANSSAGRDACLLSRKKPLEIVTLNNVENSADNDVKDNCVDTQLINIAKMRQASVATRMRGNHRLRLNMSRLNFDKKDEVNSLKVNGRDGSDLKGTLNSKLDEETLNRHVYSAVNCKETSRKIIQKCFVTAVKVPTENGKHADQMIVEKKIADESPGDFDVEEFVAEKKHQETLYHPKECSISESSSIGTEVPNSATGRKTDVSQKRTKRQEQPADRKSGSDDQIAEVNNATVTDQDNILDKNSSNYSSNYSTLKGTCCVQECQEGIDPALIRPSSLMSLLPKPAADVLNLSKFQPFVRTHEEHSRALDSCLQGNQRNTSSQRNGRSRSTVSSSSSHTPFSSTNSQNQNLSVSSATSYASFSSDDSKDAVGEETEWFNEKSGQRIQGLKKECFNNKQDIPHSCRPSCADKSQIQNVKHLKKMTTPDSKMSADFNILACSELDEQEEKNSETASPNIQTSYQIDMDSQNQQDRMITRKRNKSTWRKVDQTEDAETDKLSFNTLQNNTRRSEHTDIVSHESSTDTVTEMPQDMKLQIDDVNDSRTPTGNPDEKTESVNSSNGNWDSNIKVCNPIDPPESPEFYDQLNADARQLEHDHVTTENSLQRTFGCLQHRKIGLRKHRPNTAITGKLFERDLNTCRNFTNKEHVSASKRFQRGKASDTEHKDLLSLPRFLNLGDSFSDAREPDTGASDVANVEGKLFEMKSKDSDNSKRSCSECPHSSLKQLQRVDNILHSSSGSEYSESVSVISDYLSAGSDLYSKESESVDQKCRIWVKKTENWSGKTNEGDSDSQSDSNSCLSGLLHKNDSQRQASHRYCVAGEEVWSDTDTPQLHGTPSFMSQDHAEKDSLSENKPHTPLTCQQVHLRSESSQRCADKVLHQRPRRDWVRRDYNDSEAATMQLHRKAEISNTSVHQTYEETDDNQNIFRQADRKLSYYKAGDYSQYGKKYMCSATSNDYQCRRHHNSLFDSSSTKVQASSSSECDIDVLSQSDYDDVSAQMGKKGKKNEGHKHHPEIGQSFYADASSECRPSFYQNLLCFPYNSRSHSRSYFSPCDPETNLWMSNHHRYYDQWYSAWMAYSMGCYGYGFQEGDRSMDYSEALHGQNCGCASPACHQENSWPQPVSQPVSRPSPNNPSCGDTRGLNNGRPTQAQNRNSQQYFTEDSVDCKDQKEKLPKYCSTQYVQDYMAKEPLECVSRPTVPGEVHGWIKEENHSAQIMEDYLKQEPAIDVSCRSDVSAEMPAWIRNEQNSKTSAKIKKEVEDSENNVRRNNTSPFQNMPESRNVQNNSCSLNPSWRSCASAEPNHTCLLSDRTNLLGEHSMRENGRHFSHCHPNPCLPTPQSPKSGLQDYKDDYNRHPRFGYHAYQIPPAMMMPSLDPFRFHTPPRSSRTYSPQLASGTSACGGKGERKESSSGENHPNEQHSYKECKDVPPFPFASLFRHDMSPDWSRQPQCMPPMAAHPPPPLPLPPPTTYRCQRPRDSMSQTSCSLDTTSSEPCRLDSSFDTRGDYDASGSEQEEAGREAAASAKRRQPADTDIGFDKYAAAQRGRYLQMYKDSGSEDHGSSSLPSSKQFNMTKMSSVQGENNLSGSGAIPKCAQSAFKGLHRRTIPVGTKDRNRRSCPPAVESLPVASSDQEFQCKQKAIICSSGFLTPPAGLSYAQAVASPGPWWDKPNQWDKPQTPVMQLYEDDYPSLSASSSSLSQQLAPGAATKTPSKAGSPEENTPFSDVQEDGTCKSFFRKQSSLEQSGRGRGGKWGMSRYASRLLSDNRVAGVSKQRKEAAREAFDKRYKTSFVDTHCHLDFLFNREPHVGSYASYREKNKTTFPLNYEGCVAVFCKPKTFGRRDKWMPIVDEPGVWMAMGCHPKNACEYTDWTERELREALKHNKTVALGEIGLDYSKHYGQTSARQKEVFISQIKIALNMNLPLVIHCREAEDDCLEILEKYVPADYKIHCHCFTSNYASATKWISRFKNLFIGLTPLVTYRSAVDTHQVARLLPLEKLLLETDAPYFLPSGFEIPDVLHVPCQVEIRHLFGQGEGISLSHPGMALMVAIRVAELRSIQVEEVLGHVRRNTQEMYGI